MIFVLHLYGDLAGACFGCGPGPLVLRLPFGSWRVVQEEPIGNRSFSGSEACGSPGYGFAKELRAGLIRQQAV